VLRIYLGQDFTHFGGVWLTRDRVEGEYIQGLDLGQENSAKSSVRIPEEFSVTPRRVNTRLEAVLSLNASQKTMDGPVMDIWSGI